MKASATNAGSSTDPELAGYRVCAVQFCTLTNFYVLSVKGSWVVPKIAKCPSTGTPTATYEVGMDFQLDSIDVENGGGVNFGCTAGGAPFYDAWASEAGTPLFLSQNTNPVSPGDHMSVSITYNPTTNLFTLVVRDSTQKWTFKPPAYMDSGAQSVGSLRKVGLFLLTRSCDNSSCPIPDFGTLKTSSDYVTIATSATDTKGTKGSLANWLSSIKSQNPYAEVREFIMVDSTTTLATPTSITSTSFNIVFNHSS